ncbi:beta-ribofuranosylaminobenzene 5'-phosphate synthase family protein [Manganibacter manganicus]|uniref:GHMP kinase n=1 Tax=Manganibacter manganicus TaxID=1873176 RepID=A0A1V8RP89_9HYPH|nr:beta-ribofuranosylaminobenzene 5'-phosphate synthase family protein [Pseudaminobacter manganicus]OQM75005.1 GHMP kinase [Pseudaminobacter manganicus]
MSNCVTIRVPARLHLGFLDLNGGLGRRFGSIGLPLSEPETVLNLSRAGQASADGPDSGRAARYLATLCRHLGIGGAHRLTIEQAIPPHAGLGSGTQIALAVSAALRSLHGLPLEPQADATLLDRGARSGIGIASFHAGGIIVDGGKLAADAPPPVLAQLPFPEAWRVILILDKARAGIHGTAEVEAFHDLPTFPAGMAADICRYVLMGALPAVVERDLARFGTAIAAIQHMVGTHFAPAQGGVFTSRAVAATADRLAEAGAVGIGQSSWGPTGFAFAASQAAASAMVEAVRRDAPQGIEMRIVSGRNHGAGIDARKLDLVGS